MRDLLRRYFVRLSVRIVTFFTSFFEVPHTAPSKLKHPNRNAPVLIDASLFPPIIDAIFENASIGVLTTLRAVSWEFKHRADKILLKHVHIDLYEDPHISAIAFIEDPDDPEKPSRIVRGPRFTVPMFPWSMFEVEGDYILVPRLRLTRYCVRSVTDGITRSDSGLLKRIETIDLVCESYKGAFPIDHLLRNVRTLRSNDFQSVNNTPETIVLLEDAGIPLSLDLQLSKAIKRLVLRPVWLPLSTDPVTVIRNPSFEWKGVHNQLEELVLYRWADGGSIAQEAVAAGGPTVNPNLWYGHVYRFNEHGQSRLLIDSSRARTVVLAFTDITITTVAEYRATIPRAQYLLETTENNGLRFSRPDAERRRD